MNRRAAKGHAGARFAEPHANAAMRSTEAA